MKNGVNCAEVCAVVGNNLPALCALVLLLWLGCQHTEYAAGLLHGFTHAAVARCVLQAMLEAFQTAGAYDPSALQLQQQPLQQLQLGIFSCLQMVWPESLRCCCCSIKAFWPKHM